MALPSHWVEALFAKFSTHYGAQFAQKWAGCNLEEVKTEWAERLGRFDGQTLKAALDYCGDNCQYPPSLPEFVTICKSQRVIQKHPCLSAPEHQPTPEGKAKFKEFLELVSKSRIATGADHA